MNSISVLLIIVFCFTTNIFSQLQFIPHTITTGADGATSVYAVDVDGDGDIDVLSASDLDNKIAWYENDGNENFTPHTITTDAHTTISVYAIDVDSDGDMDVLSASVLDDKIAWYENDGNENFTPHTITTGANRATSVYAIDVDGDGDIDVLSTSFFDDRIAWYENLSPVDIAINDPPVVPVKPLLFTNYPNPFNLETIIEFDVAENLPVTLKVYDQLGREAATLIDAQLSPNRYKVTFNAQKLASGVYFYHIRMGDFLAVKKMAIIR